MCVLYIWVEVERVRAEKVRSGRRIIGALRTQNTTVYTVVQGDAITLAKSAVNIVRYNSSYIIVLEWYTPSSRGFVRRPS